MIDEKHSRPFSASTLVLPKMSNSQEATRSNFWYGHNSDIKDGEFETFGELVIRDTANNPIFNHGKFATITSHGAITKNPIESK